MFAKMAYNVWPLAPVADLKAINCQPGTKIVKSRKLSLQIKTAIGASGCYGLALVLFLLFSCPLERKVYH